MDELKLNPDDDIDWTIVKGFPFKKTVITAGELEAIKEAQAKTTIQQVLNELASKCPHGYAEKKWGCTLCEYRLIDELWRLANG